MRPVEGFEGIAAVRGTVRPAPLPDFVPYRRGVKRAGWAVRAVERAMAEHPVETPRRGRPPRGQSLEDEAQGHDR